MFSGMHIPRYTSYRIRYFKNNLKPFILCSYYHHNNIIPVRPIRSQKSSRTIILNRLSAPHTLFVWRFLWWLVMGQGDNLGRVFIPFTYYRSRYIMFIYYYMCTELVDKCHHDVNRFASRTRVKLCEIITSVMDYSYYLIYYETRVYIYRARMYY